MLHLGFGKQWARGGQSENSTLKQCVENAVAIRAQKCNAISGGKGSSLMVNPKLMIHHCQNTNDPSPRNDLCIVRVCIVVYFYILEFEIFFLCCHNNVTMVTYSRDIYHCNYGKDTIFICMKR